MSRRPSRDINVISLLAFSVSIGKEVSLLDMTDLALYRAILGMGGLFGNRYIELDQEGGLTSIFGPKNDRLPVREALIEIESRDPIVDWWSHLERVGFGKFENLDWDFPPFPMKIAHSPSSRQFENVRLAVDLKTGGTFVVEYRQAFQAMHASLPQLRKELLQVEC